MLSLRMTDILENVWIFRNPANQAESVKVKPFSVPLNKDGWALWADVLRSEHDLAS